ncbi:MAG TPA: ABC transporter substrate-binding protein [Chloroflexota bacterium]|jgi:ABC-type nitrate/sulfonate/bicarbonate transport system substrate-binding protein|nr:ABC transporter substrate-binding protein [Chloroflexota bacterium]
MALTLKTAIATYGHTAALKDGSVKPSGIDLDFVEVAPIIGAFRRMVRTLEFDVCEMAITTYLCARDHGKEFTAIPVFPVRAWHHGATSYNTSSGVQKPADLSGKKVGVRAYTVTTGVWARGILASEYGVDWDKTTLVIADEEHVAEYQAPSNVQKAPEGANLADMLAKGDLAAGIGLGKIDSPDVKPMIPNAQEAQAEWYKKTGIYPINHMIVIRNSVLQANPGVADELFNAFKASKEVFLGRLSSEAELSPEEQTLAASRKLVGEDPVPYGVEANRKALEAIIKFASDQKIIKGSVSPEEIFVPSTAKS